MIRITLLSSDVNPSSGWGSVTHTLCLAFSRRTDITFSLLLPKEASVEGNLPFSGNVRRVLPSWVSSLRWRPHRLLPLLMPGIALNGTDLIHAVVEFPYAILAWRLARRAQVPFVISTHGTYGVAPFSHPVGRWLNRRAFRDAAVITAPSAFTADAVRNASGINRDIRIIHNPVEYVRFQKSSDTEEVRHRHGLPLGARIVLSVGALKGRKGFDVLLKAFARVVPEEPRACLVIVGGGESRSLKEMATALKIASRVHVLGRMTEDDLTALYQASEVFALLPYGERANFEGFGIVYLEAGACGKPVVAARSGGVPDAVRHNETGVIVDEGDAEAAARGIVRLLRDPALATSMGEAGRRWAAAHDMSQFGEILLDIYREAIPAFRRP